jgi:hypothetical protein
MMTKDEGKGNKMNKEKIMTLLLSPKHFRPPQARKRTKNQKILSCYLHRPDSENMIFLSNREIPIDKSESLWKNSISRGTIVKSNEKNYSITDFYVSSNDVGFGRSFIQRRKGVKIYLSLPKI